ncbi:hypothetical protein JCM10213v2_005644 [Rhodosporidiobolus nylandii]
MTDDSSPDYPQFKQATVKEIFKLVTENNTRISAPALHLSAEYLRLLTTEAIHRAAEAAKEEQQEGGEAGLLEARHLEKFLAQVVTFGLFAAALPLPEGALDCSALDLLGLSFAIPFMLVGLAITATICGEFRRLWTYKEGRTAEEGEEAVGGVVLDEESVEQLPTYEASEKAALPSDQQQAEAALADDVAAQVDAKN